MGALLTGCPHGACVDGSGVRNVPIVWGDTPRQDIGHSTRGECLPTHLRSNLRGSPGERVRVNGHPAANENVFLLWLDSAEQGAKNLR